MICQKCKVREAAVTITKVINNMQITMHLCPECAKNFTPGLQKQISGVNNILMRIMGIGDLFDDETEVDNIVCPDCGLSFADFRKRGTMGCGKCYDVFRNRMESILKRLHSSFQHVGISYQGVRQTDLPKDNSEKRLQKKEESTEYNVHEKINNLKKALNEAIEKEEYEEAAKIRDMIKIMEDKPVGGNES